MPVRFQTHTEVTIYDAVQTEEGVRKCGQRLSAAFPALGPDFFAVLFTRVKEIGIGDVRLLDAVNHVIDHCVYPVPTVANIIAYDQRVKMYDYIQMCKLNDEYNGKAWDYYTRLECGMYCSNLDIEKYNLK